MILGWLASSCAPLDTVAFRLLLTVLKSSCAFRGDLEGGGGGLEGISDSQGSVVTFARDAFLKAR